MNYALEAKQIEFLKQSFSESDYQNYLAYSTPFFRKKEIIQEDDFQIQVYEIIGEENGTAFSAYAVFVNRLNLEKFTISEDLFDQNDLTNLTVETDVLVYSHIDEMKLKDNFISITKGYREYKGYYYIFVPEEEREYLFTLYDYEGMKFSDFKINYNFSFESNLGLNDLDDELEQDWLKGYTGDEKINLVLGRVHRDMLIYGIFIVLFGLFLFRKTIFRKRT
jgi:hypothetical protein